MGPARGAPGRLGPVYRREPAGSLVLPDGAGGTALLVYDNFRTIKKWNNSTFFAAAVGYIADSAGRPDELIAAAIRAQWGARNLGIRGIAASRGGSAARITIEFAALTGGRAGPGGLRRLRADGAPRSGGHGGYGSAGRTTRSGRPTRSTGSGTIRRSITITRRPAPRRGTAGFDGSRRPTARSTT